MVVDYQCHWWPPALLEWLEQREHVPRARRAEDGWVYESNESAVTAAGQKFVDLAQHLAVADAEGVDVMVLGPAAMGEVMHLPAEEAVDILEHVNREVAQAQIRHPDRIVALATLPMQDVASALQTLERAWAIGLRGVSILTSNAGRPIATTETLPIYRRIEELGMPVVLHPASGGNVPISGSWRMRAGLGWMYQTTAAALDLIDSGTLDQCPGLTILHPHLGGVFPYVMERIDGIDGGAARLPIREYLRTRFYVDTVGPTPGALRLAVRTYGLDRILFGTDYPFFTPAEVKGWVAASATPDEADVIYANRLPGLPLPG